MTGKLKRALPLVAARIGVGDDAPTLRVSGRTAEALLRLVRRGEKGLAAFDYEAGPPWRLAAYIFELRQAGVNIETVREPHGENLWHGRFFLRSPVEIVAVSDVKRFAANGR